MLNKTDMGKLKTLDCHAINKTKNKILHLSWWLGLDEMTQEYKALLQNNKQLCLCTVSV